MSFQDISRRASNRPTSGGPARFPSAAPPAPAAGGRGGSLGGAVDAVGENLRQFQHNLSLLERLADHLGAQPRASDELLRQVTAQQDVVDELARALRSGHADLLRRIDAAPRADQARPRAAHAKLRKDFDRVQGDVGRVIDKIKASRRAALARGAAPEPAARGGAAGAAARDARGGAARGGGGSGAPRPPVSGGGGARAPPPPPEHRGHRVGRAQFGPSDAPGDLDVMIGEERVQLQVAMQEEAINDAILREREEEIREINSNVHKVNEIFRDLATLVDKQQADVDQIGELVEKSHAHAEKGLDQVQKAAKLQPSCAVS